MRRIRIWLVVLALFCECHFAFAQRSDKEQPNIILLFADDAGYHDFGFQGSHSFKTPQLDKLATEGVILNQFYVTAAVCGPSRAGMLTGMYQQRFGFEENNVPGYMSPSGPDGEDMGLPVHLKTMGDHLKNLGYRTAIYGKWHMGGRPEFHPLSRGFDEFYGFRDGARSYYAMSQEEAVKDPMKRLERDFGNFEEHEGYLTDVLADEASEFIARNRNTPFFLFLSFNAVHTPMQAKPEDLELFPELTGKRKTLAAMTWAMDRACGKVLDALKVNGIEDNTILIFTNDNGGPTDASSANNYPLSGTKANHLEGGIRVPCIVKWPGKIEGGTTYDNMTSTLDFLPTFLSAAGAEPDTIPGIDGVDLLSYLNGAKTDEQPHDQLFWKKENRGAVRMGDWKLLRFPDRPAELYLISDDQAEENNLAHKYPERVKAMYKALFEWELTLERPLWQLKRYYEGKAMERMDKYRSHNPD